MDGLPIQCVNVWFEIVWILLIEFRRQQLVHTYFELCDSTEQRRTIAFILYNMGSSNFSTHLMPDGAAFFWAKWIESQMNGMTYFSPGLLVWLTSIAIKISVIDLKPFDWIMDGMFLRICSAVSPHVHVSSVDCLRPWIIHWNGTFSVACVI